MLRPLSRLRHAVRARRGRPAPPATHATRLGRRARLVQEQDGPQLAAERLGRRAWLVQPARGRGRHSVTRLGSDERRTVLLSPPRVSGRDRMPLLKHLANEHVAEVLEQLEVTCVLDVGANKGQYASRLREAGYTGRIVSFEPLPHLAERIEQRSSDDPDWRLMPYALGREDTESQINVDPGKGTLSSLLGASDFGRSWNERLREEEQQQTVQVRRLDGLWDEVLEGLEDPRVYLKLDTQGFDLEAFAGAGERVQDVLGMQSEIAGMPIYDGMPEMSEQLEAYRSAGFTITGMFPVGVHRRTMGVIEFDAVMVRPEAVVAARAARRQSAKLKRKRKQRRQRRRLVKA